MRAGSLALLSFLVAGCATVADGGPIPLADHARAANGRCATGVVGGAMGVHYVHGGYLKDEVPDIKRPQAVMYEPLPDGKMALIAVEYITFKGPASLEGQLFNFTGAPNRYGLGPFYELHVWAWKANPRGAFADMNPNVTCHHHAPAK